MQKTLISKLLALAFFVSLPAHADLGVLGGLNYWKPSLTASGFTTDATVSSSAAIGAFYRHSLVPFVDYEIDAIYVKRKNQLVIPSILNATFETKAIQVPVLLRVDLLPAGLLNVGAGPYYEFGLGGGVDVNGVNQSYSSQNLKHNDWGLLGSVQTRIPVLPGLLAVMADLRYVYGMTEQSTSPAVSIKNRYIQAFIGASLGLF